MDVNGAIFAFIWEAFLYLGFSAGPFGIADEGMFLLFEALMKCLLKEELFGGRENEETNHSRVC